MSTITKDKRVYVQIGLGLLIAGLFLFFFILPFTIWGDGLVRYQFMQNLIEKLAITPMRYSMIGPIFSLPLWLLSTLFNDPSAIVSRYNLLIYIIFIGILYQWLRNIVDKSFLLTFLLILTFASMFPGHLINYYGEVFSAVCLALGVIGLGLNKKWISWILLVLAVLNTPALLIALILVVLYITIEKRQIRYLSILPLCLILMVGESYLRTGSVLGGFQTYLSYDSGYSTILPYSGKTGFSYPFLLGIISILLSFGKGIIFYCSGLLLAVLAWKNITGQAERKIMILWLLSVVGLILAYASWWAWYGGWYWGPRFFLFASIPASWFIARAIHSTQKSILVNSILIILMTLSFWVGVNGVVFQQNTLDLCTQNNYALEYLCWYVPEFSPLWRPFVASFDLHYSDIVILALFAYVWLYYLIPCLMNISPQVKNKFQRSRYLLKMSTWKF